MEGLGYSNAMLEIQTKVWDLETVIEDLEDNRNSINREIIDLKDQIKKIRRGKDFSVNYNNRMMELQVRVWDLKDKYKNICRSINENNVKVNLLKKEVMRERDVMIRLR